MTLDQRIHCNNTQTINGSNLAETNFWWKTAGEPFARMLSMSKYPASVRSAYISMFRNIVCPELGVDPQLSITPTSQLLEESYIVSKTQGASPGFPIQQYRSYMTDDHSPIEFSCIFSKDGSARIRFAIDPITRQREDVQPAIQVFQEISKSLSLANIDLTWCYICAEELCTSSVTTLANGPRPPRHPSQYFVGFDLGHHSVGLKAYFLTESRAASLGVPKLDLVSAVIKRISTVPHDLLPNLTIAWNRLSVFLKSLPVHLQPSAEIVAVDCVPSHMNRLKIYIRTPRASFSVMKHFMTLGLTQEQRTTSSALLMAKVFWKLLFPGLPEQDEPNIAQERLRHPTSGLLFYYELRGDMAIPLPKVYIPVRHLCSDDESIIHAIVSTYRFAGQGEAEQQYAGFVRESFKHRILSTRSGVHTYVAFAAKSDKAEITTYFNPECYGTEREDTRSSGVRL